jgi:hypothetical protein
VTSRSVSSMCILLLPLVFALTTKGTTLMRVRWNERQIWLNNSTHSRAIRKYNKCLTILPLKQFLLASRLIPDEDKKKILYSMYIIVTLHFFRILLQTSRSVASSFLLHHNKTDYHRHQCCWVNWYTKCINVALVYQSQ